MKQIITILTILVCFQVEAQLVKQRTIDASIGYGLSIPYDDVNIAGSGLYLQGEYVLVVSKWLDFRPYAGLILTKSNGKDLDENPTIYKTTANAFMVGGKIRLTAPIPWIAPFIEVGVGTSIGSFETFTPYTNKKKSGFIPHIPFTMGLELGRKHNFDLSLGYYIHPTLKQSAGAVALGVSFPLN